jgi:hypothetical protein
MLLQDPLDQLQGREHISVVAAGSRLRQAALAGVCGGDEAGGSLGAGFLVGHACCSQGVPAGGCKGGG